MLKPLGPVCFWQTLHLVRSQILANAATVENWPDLLHRARIYLYLSETVPVGDTVIDPCFYSRSSPMRTTRRTTTPAAATTSLSGGILPPRPSLLLCHSALFDAWSVHSPCQWHIYSYIIKATWSQERLDVVQRVILTLRLSVLLVVTVYCILWSQNIWLMSRVLQHHTLI